MLRAMRDWRYQLVVGGIQAVIFAWVAYAAFGNRGFIWFGLIAAGILTAALVMWQDLYARHGLWFLCASILIVFLGIIASIIRTPDDFDALQGAVSTFVLAALLLVAFDILVLFTTWLWDKTAHFRLPPHPVTPNARPAIGGLPAIDTDDRQSSRQRRSLVAATGRIGNSAEGTGSRRIG